MTDYKITELTESTDPVGADLFAIVDDPSGSAVTKKIPYDTVFGFVNKLSFTAASELTCDTDGAVTVTQNFHTIDTNADAASGDLVTINGGAAGRVLIIRPANDARTIVVKHNTGNILLQGGKDITLDDQGDSVHLVYDSGLTKWIGGQFYNDDIRQLVNAKGDFLVGTADDTLTRFAVGTTDGQKLVVKAAATEGIAWIDDDFGFNFVIGSGSVVVSTGVAGYVELPFDGVFESCRLLPDASGSIVVDIWKQAYANYPPADTDSITSTDTPTISSATKYEDTALGAWTKTFSAGDILGFNVDSVTTIKQCTVSLRGRRTATA